MNILVKYAEANVINAHQKFIVEYIALLMRQPVEVVVRSTVPTCMFKTAPHHRAELRLPRNL